MAIPYFIAHGLRSLPSHQATMSTLRTSPSLNHPALAFASFRVSLDDAKAHQLRLLRSNRWNCSVNGYKTAPLKRTRYFRGAQARE